MRRKIQKKEKIMQGQLLTVKEAAEWLKWHPMTVVRWALDGRLPSVKIGRSRRIPSEALRQFVNERIHGTCSDLSAQNDEN